MNVETATKLVALRKKNGLSQEELAERIGVSRQAISKWERAESSPDTDNLISLAKIYGISIDEMLNGKTPTGGYRQQENQTANETNNTEGGVNWKAFPYPIIVTIIYLVLGFIYGLWHPGWLIFMTVPLWAALVGKDKEEENEREEKRLARIRRRSARRNGYDRDDWMNK